MKSIKIYNKQGKLELNKNNFLCLIYKYEIEKEIVYSINLSDKISKFHSIFEYLSISECEKIKISITEDWLEYKIEKITKDFLEIEEGRFPIKNNKKNWSKKSLWKDGFKLVEVENFNNCRSVIYKPKKEVFTNLININNEQARRKKRTRN